MKILFYLTRYPGFGGIETVTTTIATTLQKQGHSIVILSHLQQDTNQPICKCRIFTMPNNKKWDAKENQRYIKELLKTEKFDTIIYQDSYAPTEHIICSLAQEFNIPLLVFEHSSPRFIYYKKTLDPIFTVKGFLRRVLHKILLQREKNRKRYLYNHCKKYVVLSKYYIPEFIQITGIKDTKNKICSINNPICNNQSIYQSKENIILYVGRLSKSKGVDKMIVLWNQLSSTLDNWKFIIVGDGEEKDNLQHLANVLGVKNISFEGFQDPTKYYSRAKIFWMMSKYEGWPMSLLESMQSGCVPIAYETFSSIYEIIDNKISGILIRPENTNSFKENTLFLCTHDIILNEMSQAAIQKVKQFDLSHIIEHWTTLLADLNIHTPNANATTN